MPSLFDRERHNWMNFHANDVICPSKSCYGILLWKEGEIGRILKCQVCQKEYIVLEAKKEKFQKPKERIVIDRDIKL